VFWVGDFDPQDSLHSASVRVTKVEAEQKTPAISYFGQEGSGTSFVIQKIQPAVELEC